jgi:hypothetical protein
MKTYFPFANEDAQAFDLGLCQLPVVPTMLTAWH